MRPQPLARAEATFNSAIERPANERAAYLAHACGDDGALHAEVMAWLKAHEAAEGFMQDDALSGHRPEKTAAEFWKEYDAKKK